MRAYLQANVGTTAVVDEEIEVCTADMTDLQIILIKIEIFASAKIYLNFAAGKLSLERSEIITPPQGGSSLERKRDYNSRFARYFPYPIAFFSVL